MVEKVLDIKEEIINKRQGVHFIKGDLEESLKRILKKFNNEGLFNKYNMSYIYKYNEDGNITLVLHKSNEYIK